MEGNCCLQMNYWVEGLYMPYVHRNNVKERESSFLTAHQHIIGYSVKKGDRQTDRQTATRPMHYNNCCYGWASVINAI